MVELFSGIFSVFVSVRYFTDFTLSAPSCGIILFNNFKSIDEVCLPWILVIAQSFPSCGVWASHCGSFSCCRAQVAVVAACGLSCPVAYGVLPDRGLNLGPRPWQADS